MSERLADHPVDRIRLGSARLAPLELAKSLDPGRMLWVGAGTKRKLEPGPDGVRVLAIGSTPGAPYERPEGLQLLAQR